VDSPLTLVDSPLTLVDSPLTLVDSALTHSGGPPAPQLAEVTLEMDQKEQTQGEMKRATVRHGGRESRD